jgi:aminoglycoside phosphotransferase (APT) family kinase protein
MLGNLIYLPSREIGVIDFNRWDFGDPYEEFYKLQSFSRETSPLFSYGQILGYFDGEVPESFWTFSKALCCTYFVVLSYMGYSIWKQAS